MTLLSIFVLVPQGLPWEDGISLTLPSDGDGEIALTFHRRAAAEAGAREAFAIADAAMRASVDASTPAGEVAMPLGDAHTTVVEITMTLTEASGASDDHEAVHRGIDALHRVDLATVIANAEARCPVGPADVWPVIPALSRPQPGDASEPSSRTIVLGEGKPLPASSPPLGKAAVVAVAAALGAIEAGDPTTRWWEWRSAALASQQAMRPALAAVQLAVAVEVLLDGARALTLYESGISPESAAEALAEGPRGQLGAGFGLEPGGWEVVAALRAAVLHRGWQPTADQFGAALRAADEIHQGILEWVLRRKAELPITAALFAADRPGPQGASDGSSARRRWLADYLAWRTSAPESRPFC